MSHLGYRALSSLPRKRALDVFAILLMACCLGASTCPANESQPSPTTARALEDIASTRPCTAAALLHVMRRSDAATSGVFYLPDYPTRSIVTLLIDRKDGGQDFQLQPNLYADVPYYIEVRWSLEKLNDKVVVFRAEAQLVSPAGVKLTPTHLIEPQTGVLMVGQSLRVLPTAAVE